MEYHSRLASIHAHSRITPPGLFEDDDDDDEGVRGAGKFYGWRTKTWKEDGQAGEQQRLSSDQGSLRATPLVCAEVRRARLWRVLSPKNVLVARSFADGSPGKETKAGIRVKCNHSPRVSAERNPEPHGSSGAAKRTTGNATCR